MARSRQSSGAGAPHLQANVAELRALAHPLRLRIMELFAESPKTTKHVAELLGEPPTRLYHHVAALERAGLIHLKETRRIAGPSRNGTSPSRGLWVRSVMMADGVGPNAAAKRAVAMTVLEQSRREMVNAMAKPGAEPPLLARLVMRAPAAMVPTLRRRLYGFLKEIQTEFECDDSAPTADEHERWAMTIDLRCPVWPTGSRAAEAQSGKLEGSIARHSSTTIKCRSFREGAFLVQSQLTSHRSHDISAACRIGIRHDHRRPR